MYVNLFRKFFCVILFVSQSLLLLSQEKNFSISRNNPSWIIKIDQTGGKPNLKDISDGYYSSLIERQHHAELHEQYYHVIRQIVSDAGVQNGSQVSVTYDPSYQKLIVHKVTVWRNNQSTDKLATTKFTVLQNEKDLSRFIYSGTYDAYLLLDDIRKGDRIEFSYTIKGLNPVFGNRYADDFYFEYGSSVGHLYTSLITSKKRHLNLKNFNFDTAPKKTELNGLIVYEWESRLTKTHRQADYEPSWYNPYKHTQVSEYMEWSEIVDWGIRVNSYAGLKTPLVDKKVEDLLVDAEYDKEKYVELAARFVQDEIRYMGLEMGEYSQRPNSPEKVFKQRYGDCKDKSLLLTYLLNKADITAYMAYIDTYAGRNTSSFLPSPIVFNHVVVVVEYNHNKTWIDPTISYQRGKFKDIYFPNYGQALVLKPGNTRPEDLITYDTGKLSADLVFNVADTANNKKSTLIINSTYTDNCADDIRGMVASDGIESVEKSFFDYIKKYYPNIESTGPIEIKDDEDTNTIHITESYELNNFWKQEDDDDPKRSIDFYGDLISNNIREINAKNRLEPLALKYPLNIEQRIYINLPYVSNTANDKVTVENDNFFFEFSSFHKGRQIVLYYSYIAQKPFIEVEDLKKYVSDIKTINSSLSYYINWTGQSGSGGEGNNPYLTILGVLAFIISGFFFLRVYQEKNDFDLEKLTYAQPLGGWLILLAIILIISIFTLPATFISTGIFSTAAWDNLTAFKTGDRILISIVFIIEVIAYAIQYSWLLLIVVLFFNRREVLPEQFIKYLIFATSLMIFDLAMAAYIGTISGKQATNVSDITRLLTKVAGSFIWFAYFKRSVRVKETFVFTYPDFLWKKQLLNAAYMKRNTNTSDKVQITDQDERENNPDVTGNSINTTNENYNKEDNYKKITDNNTNITHTNNEEL